jgi:methanogenic corrinoid protein MtbC1
MSSVLAKAFSDLDEDTVLQQVKDRLAANEDASLILTDCREGLKDVGKRYEQGEYYVSDLMLSGELFKMVNAEIGDRAKGNSGPTRGKVVIATVKGDIHDIGKDIVVGLLQASNYEVTDLGVDVPVDKIIAAVKETGAPVLGLSGLLTIAFDTMKEVVEQLKAEGLREKTRVMIGGGSLTEPVVSYVGADGWGTDAQAAVYYCDQWFKES